MRITNEQVSKALEYLRTTDEYRGCDSLAGMCRYETDLARRVTDRVMRMPDIRDERVEEVKARGRYLPDADTLAQSLLNRMVSDAIR